MKNVLAVVEQYVQDEVDFTSFLLTTSMMSRKGNALSIAHYRQLKLYPKMKSLQSIKVKNQLMLTYTNSSSFII